MGPDSLTSSNYPPQNVTVPSRQIVSGSGFIWRFRATVEVYIRTRKLKMWHLNKRWKSPLPHEFFFCRPPFPSLFSVSFLKIYLLYSVLPSCMPACQKRALDLILDACKAPYGCWEPDSGPRKSSQCSLWVISPAFLCVLIHNINTIHFLHTALSLSHWLQTTLLYLNKPMILRSKIKF